MTAQAALTRQQSQELANNPTSDLNVYNDTSFWCQEFIEPVAELDAIAYSKAHPEQTRDYMEMQRIGLQHALAHGLLGEQAGFYQSYFEGTLMDLTPVK